MVCTKKSERIFFLLSRLEHARMWRRVLRLKEAFGETFVGGFERNGFPVEHKHECVSFGTFSHRNFIGRIKPLGRAWRVSYRELKRSDVGYAFSLDLLLFLYIIKLISGARCKLVYEVADIHPILTSDSFLGKIARSLEKYLVLRCRLVVFTSEGFRDGYFRDVQGLSNFSSVVIEHKVELPRSKRDEVQEPQQSDNRLRINYIGFMKSPASFEFLHWLAGEASDKIVVKFWGHFVFPLDEKECLRRVSSLPNLEYMGPYNSPDDLLKVYQSCDFVWDYYEEGENARWQRTTRFSEACFFKRPMFYNPETPDGRLAKSMEIGIPVDIDEKERLLDRLNELTRPQILEEIKRMDRVPDDLIYYGEEYEQLCRELSAS